MSRRHPVFLDADVLAAPRTRTMILVAQFHADARYRAVWSRLVEDQANHALLEQAEDHVRRTGERWTNRASVTDVRLKYLPDMRLLTPAPAIEASLVDTARTDRPVLAAAASAGVHVLVTSNAGDFGEQDLAQWGMSAVSADRFLAHTMSEAMYLDTLRSMLKGRSGPPYTAAEAHHSLSRVRPELARRMGALFPDVALLAPAASSHSVPFRGTRCVVCVRPLTDHEAMIVGVHRECRRGG